MLLGVIPIFCFEFLRIFGEKSQKSKKENLGKHGPLRRSIGNPHSGVAYAAAWDALTVARPGCQNGTPRVRHDIALLRHSRELCRSVIMLCCGVDTVN